MKKIAILIFLFSVSMAYTMPLSHITVTGKITATGKPIEGIAVTDGISVVWTDAKGDYRIETLSDRKYIYYSCPCGYNSPITDGIPKFFEKINNEVKYQTINFELTKSDLAQDRHAFIAWADPQVLDMDEFPLLEKVAKDVKKTVALYKVPVHAISLGDNVFDKLDFFVPYKKIAASVGVPFYQVIGNHDMDYNERSNELSDESYTSSFGPSYYSFNIGKIHYIVLKDVFYTGYSYRYIGYIDERQLAWLEQDITRLRKGQTIILATHIPTHYGDSEHPRGDEVRSNSVLNNNALYKLLEPFNTHILAGHSHTQWNTQIKDNLLEHTHAAASAAWWQGDVGLDGTPMGYTVYEVAGDSIRWHFKGVDKSIDEQFKVYSQGDTIIVNVFNYDTQWKVELANNGKVVDELQRYWGKDPYAAELYVPGTNKKHSWLGAGSTYHLFRIVRPINAQNLAVVVTDRFGKKYTKLIK